MPNGEGKETTVMEPAKPATSLLQSAVSWRSALGWATRVKELNILVALLILCTFLSIRSDVFLTQGNLFGVARAFSLTAIVAIGQTMVIITGGIDLSVGSVLALSGITTGLLLGEGWPLGAAMLGGLLVGSLTGLINGLLITQVGLPPFIATLGTLGIGRGLVYVLTKGYPVTIPREHQFLLNLGQGYVGSIPVPVISQLWGATSMQSAATKKPRVSRVSTSAW